MAAKRAANRDAPLYSLEAEQSVIGGLLLNASAWPRVAGLTAGDFYRPDHRTIFAAIDELCGAGKVADTIMVTELLKSRGSLDDVGGFSAVASLARDTAGTSNIEAYAEKVREYALRRRLGDLGAAITREAGEGGSDGASGLLARVQERLLSLQASSRSGKRLVSSRDLATDFIDDLDRRCDKPKGLQLGLADFDGLTNGLEAGDLVVVAGRPGMGKTALLVSIAAHVAQSQPVAVFSAEMPARQLMRRCVALLGRISQGRLRRADQLTQEDWNCIWIAAAAAGERQLWIDDTALPALAHIRAECMGLKARTGLGLVIIDYVQLVQGHGANRYEQLRDVAYGCKALAKDLAVPVIVLGQLNRGVESRDSKEPQMSDLRDSGAIEEAADIIGLLFSKGYYDPEFEMPHVLECQIEKHRNGERGECLWHFAGEHSHISVLDSAAAIRYRLCRAQQRRARKGATNDL
jgi:replicative DNA helicase